MQHKKSNYTMEIFCLGINLFFALLLWTCGQTSEIFSLGLGIMVCFVYVLFFITLDNHKKLYYCFYNILAVYSVITLTYRKNFGRNCINWLQFENILLIVYLISLLTQNGMLKKALKDRFVMCYVLFCLVYSLHGIIMGNGVIQVLCVFIIYLRCIPIYLGVRYNKQSLGIKDLVFFIVANIIPMPIELVRFSVDDLAGLYGMLGVTPLSLIAVFIFGLAIASYTHGKMSTPQFIICNVVYYGFCIFGEVKFGIIILPILEIIVLLLNFNYKESSSIARKKLFTTISMPSFFAVAYILLLRYNAKWVERINREGGLINYLLYYGTSAKVLTSESKFSVHIYLYKSALTSLFYKLFGYGIGSGMPSETCQIEFRDAYLFRNTEYFTPYLTRFYNQFSFSLGYHTSTSAVMLLETGIIGTLIVFFCLVAFIIKNWKLIRAKDTNISIPGCACLMFMIYLLPFMIYYNSILRLPIAINIMLIFGLTNRIYADYRSKQISANTN